MTSLFNGRRNKTSTQLTHKIKTKLLTIHIFCYTIFAFPDSHKTNYSYNIRRFKHHFDYLRRIVIIICITSNINTFCLETAHKQKMFNSVLGYLVILFWDLRKCVGVHVLLRWLLGPPTSSSKAHTNKELFHLIAKFKIFNFQNMFKESLLHVLAEIMISTLWYSLLTCKLFVLINNTINFYHTIYRTI